MFFLPAYGVVGNQAREAFQPNPSGTDSSRWEERSSAAGRSHRLAVNSTAKPGFRMRNEKCPTDGHFHGSGPAPFRSFQGYSAEVDKEELRKLYESNRGMSTEI